MHKPTLVLTGLVVGLATLCGIQKQHEFKRAVKLDTVYASEQAHATKIEIRKVYPHSLIPGGVRGIYELRLRIQSDPILSRYYEGFSWADARSCMLPTGRYFVSVRSESEITWSKTPIERGGQNCITDGTRTILTKCGNEVLVSQETTDENQDFPPYEIEAPVYEEIEVPKLSIPTTLGTTVSVGESTTQRAFGLIPVWGVYNPQTSEPHCTDSIEVEKSCN